MHDSNEKLTPAQTAQIFNTTPNTLAKHRSQGIGCGYLKINGKVRYERGVVEAFAAKSTTRHDPSEAK